MAMRGENGRFWTPVVLLLLFAAYATYKLVIAHVDPKVASPDYVFSKTLPARRGAVYAAATADGAPLFPFAKSVPVWEYRLDPVALTDDLPRKYRKDPAGREKVVKTIADALGLDYQKVLKMANSPRRRGYRSQFLARSTDANAYRILVNRKEVSGVGINDLQIRQYIDHRRLCHVLGSVNAEFCGSAGIEQRYNRELSGTAGTIEGMRDARGRELRDKRTISSPAIPGHDIHLTIDHNIQFETEDALKWGLAEYGAGAGWCIVMDAKTGAIRAMASLPNFEPEEFGHVPDDAKINRAISFIYEPGSVMKTITVAAAIDSGFTTPGTRYSTDRYDKRYYKLPGDGSHKWEPTMTVKDAIVHSSNIVVGKLGYDFGPTRLYAYMRKFGFGQLSGVELPGEQYGILPNPHKRMWDKASQSRAAIGQFVAVTGLQLVSAYQAIANDGLRMKPYIVDHIVDSTGKVTYRAEPKAVARAVSAKTSRTMREMMLGVASPQGTARRAAIRGYSVAGKTGTAQKALNGHYVDGLYRASFCGMVPATDPQLVILVTLDFDARTKYHQGGNSAGPVFKRVALSALRYLMIPPDRPEELSEFSDEDELDKILEQRSRKYGIIRNN